MSLMLLTRRVVAMMVVIECRRRYSHPPVGLNYSFDAFENENEAAAQPAVAAQLAAMLREVVANQTRIPSLRPTADAAAAAARLA